MASIGQIFPKARKLSYDCRTLLQSYNPQTSPSSSVPTLTQTVSELRSNLAMLNRLLLNEPPNSRALWVEKLRELGEECEGMEREVAMHVNRRNMYNAQAIETQRSSLFNDDNNGNGGGMSHRRVVNIGEDDLAYESKSLDSSSNMMSSLLNQGSDSLNELQGQRDRLKGVQRAVFDIGRSLGISKGVLRAIERRDIR
jgi:Golgi SNAP receptor complex protein 2